MYRIAVRASSFESFIQLIGVLVIFLFVLGVTYVATRWIAGYLVLAIGKDEVRLLTKLTGEQLKEIPSGELPEGITTESFKEIFEKIKKHIPKK